jgi:DNA-binding transcriptional LysR family regulator
MLKDITFNQLRVFREVARHESFTRAAAALYISQPAVSKAVKELARQCGAALFEQVGRRIQLTDAGRILEAHAGRIFTELADVERAFQGLIQGEQGHLVIGASNTPGTYLVPEALGRFRHAHPGVEVTLEIGDTRQVLQRLTEGAFDLAVVGEAAYGASLVVRPYREDRLVLIVPPGHPLARQERLALQDLEDLPFVLREAGSSTREILERELSARGFIPRLEMEVGSAETVKKVVEAGLALSFISEHAVGLELQVGALVARPVSDLEIRRQLNIVWRSSLSLTRIHEQFLTALGVWESESPLVLVDGKPADCCQAGPVTEAGLRAAGIGAP